MSKGLKDKTSLLSGDKLFTSEKSEAPNLANLQYLGGHQVNEAIELHERKFDGDQDELHEARVGFIFEMIQAGDWVRVRTDRELGAVWGISLRRVQKISAEAERHLRLPLGDPETFRTMFVYKLEAITDDARHATKPMMNKDGDIEYAKAPDFSSAIKGISEAAKLLKLYERKPKNPNDRDEEALEELLDKMRQQIEEKTIDTTGQPVGPERVISVQTEPTQGDTYDIERED